MIHCEIAALGIHLKILVYFFLINFNVKYYQLTWISSVLYTSKLNIWIYHEQTNSRVFQTLHLIKAH